MNSADWSRLVIRASLAHLTRTLLDLISINLDPSPLFSLLCVINHVIDISNLYGHIHNPLATAKNFELLKASNYHLYLTPQTDNNAASTNNNYNQLNNNNKLNLKKIFNETIINNINPSSIIISNNTKNNPNNNISTTTISNKNNSVGTRADQTDLPLKLFRRHKTSNPSKAFFHASDDRSIDEEDSTKAAQSTVPPQTHEAKKAPNYTAYKQPSKFQMFKRQISVFSESFGTNDKGVTRCDSFHASLTDPCKDSQASRHTHSHKHSGAHSSPHVHRLLSKQNKESLSLQSPHTTGNAVSSTFETLNPSHALSTVKCPIDIINNGSNNATSSDKHATTSNTSNAKGNNKAATSSTSTHPQFTYLTSPPHPPSHPYTYYGSKAPCGECMLWHQTKVPEDYWT